MKVGGNEKVKEELIQAFQFVKLMLIIRVDEKREILTIKVYLVMADVTAYLWL